MDSDIGNPTYETEHSKCKKDRLIQSPNSYFMDVKCSNCSSISTVFSHAQTASICPSCSNKMTTPTGGKCELTPGSAYKIKNNN